MRVSPIKSKKADPVFTAALVAVAFILLAGLVLAFLSIISPFTFAFLAVMLPLFLGPVAEIRGIY